MTSEPPHRGVCVRLGPSGIHGVGVFAITPIPKGTDVFYGDDAELVWVEKATTEHLPPPLRKLYKDFCVSKGRQYGCPDSFNHMTPAWYLNHSKTPNVVADEEYRFFAARDIAQGEELTVDYSTYSDSFDGTFSGEAASGI